MPLALIAFGYAAYIYAGVRAGGTEPTGTLAGIGVVAPVTIDRDDRGIPHVRARNEHDLFFAEGYLQATDRLFQLDIYRRLVGGRLSEVFGQSTLATDEEARVFDVDGVVRDEERALDARGRANAQAFVDGINAAVRTRPLPPEFRILAYRPEPWTIHDVLLTAFSTVLALTDSWQDVLLRDDVATQAGEPASDAFFPITDPAYDAPTTGGPPAPVPSLPPLRLLPRAKSWSLSYEAPDRAGLGSNNVVAGAARTTTGRALLGNDPHLGLHIPGVWWLADLAAPGIHIAGATLVGAPGIILGHNAHFAWGATNGTVATTQVYRERFADARSDRYAANGTWLTAQHRTETFGVRWSKPATREYLRTRHGFVFAERGAIRYAAAWSADVDRRSSLATFDGLDRAANVASAFGVLSRYPGPPQNFVLADDRGDAGYVLAGEIPLDAAWGRRAHDGATSPAGAVRYVPFAALPHVKSARDAVAFTANDRVYAAGYPYRLSAEFEAPYRANRIGAALRAKPRYGVADFSAIQADTLSLPERDLARAAVAALQRRGSGGDARLDAARRALSAYDGHMVEDSLGAVYAWELRRAANQRILQYHFDRELAYRYLSANSGIEVVTLLRMLREKPKGWVPNDDYDAFLIDALRQAIDTLASKKQLGAPWADVGARIAYHPLASFRYDAWDGPRFPGHGSGYSPHVQGVEVTQSFRAVWDVGNWEAGGIVIPIGESGEPGSPHYRDLVPTWFSGRLVPLPFGDAAVRQASRSTLTLIP